MLAGVKLAKQSYDIVPKIIKGGGDGVKTVEMLTAVGYPANEGWYATTASPHLTDDPRMASWVGSFKAKYNANPGGYSVTAFDAALVIAAAIRKVTDGGAAPTREAVRDAIQSVKVDTLQGPLSFDANGDLEDKTISVFQVRQDRSIPAGDPRQFHYIGVAPATDRVSFPDLLLQQTINGLSLGTMYALLALGFTVRRNTRPGRQPSGPKQAAEAAAQQPAVREAHAIQAAEVAPGEDQELRYRNTLDAEQAAYQAAGLAKLTPLMIMAKIEHPIGDMLLSAIFPEHQDSHCIGFCVTAEPGRIIAQRDPATDDADDTYTTIRIRGAIRLEVGEVCMRRFWSGWVRMRCAASSGFSIPISPCRMAGGRWCRPIRPTGRMKTSRIASFSGLRWAS